MSRWPWVSVLTAVFSAAWAVGQPVAVYESETNGAEYRGVYQEPLRTWLTQRGQEYRVIGDAQSADPAALADCPAVLASSVYLVPEAAAEGLAAYVRSGGRLMWLDCPARCRNPQLRAVLGLGLEGRYVDWQRSVLSPAAPGHPAVLQEAQTEVSRLAGNPCLQLAPGAQELLQMHAAEGNETLPALVAARSGDGLALVYNWIPWTSPQEEVPALLADGLDYLLADAAIARRSLAAAAGVTSRAFRQPQSVSAVCKVYRRVGSTGQVRCTAGLFSGNRAVERAPEQIVQWTHTDGRLEAGLVFATLNTEGLEDGPYEVRWRVTGEGLADTLTSAVALDGQRWARLAQEQRARRKLLEPRLLGTLGDYDAEPRTPEGRVDLPRLMEQIRTAHMTMYDFLIWHAPTDWEDLQAFLPLAKANGITVWVTLCPPSEQGGDFPHSEPYRLDYVRWADEIGTLAEKYDNLAALVIDDFWSTPNHSLFTPAYIAAVVATLRKHDPKVAFLPTIYWDTVGDADWIERYGLLIDGIVFPYCEYVTADGLEAQLAACRGWIGPERFLLVNVYAAGSGGGDALPRTAAYVRKALTVSREHSDGIRIYCLPKEELLQDERYAVTAELYGEWGEER